MSTDTNTLRSTIAALWLRGAVGTISMALTVLACYGVLALTLLLPLVGIRLSVDQAAWAGTIAAFAVLTVLAVLPGFRVHRSAAPGVGAVAGGGLILYALTVDYQFLVELTGFLLLAVSVLRDVQLRRRARRRGPAGEGSRIATG